MKRPIAKAMLLLLLHTGTRTVRTLAREAWNTLRIASSRDYGLALAASLVALVVSLLAASVDADDSVAAIVFLSAVGVTGWFGGLGPALAGTVFGAVAIDYFFETPPHELAITSPRTVVDLLSFLIVALLLGTLNARVRVSHDQLRAERDRAQAAVRSRDDLMAMVSHELRTPLTKIKTSVYSLRIRSPRLRPDRREHLLATIESEADRLVHFVTESLALRKLENAENPQWELCAPCEVASAVLDRCLPSLGSRSVEFSVREDLPLVRIDPFLTAQALGVLLRVFVSNPGRLLTQRTLLMLALGPTYQDAIDNLRTFVNQLRARIERDPARPQRIVTEPGLGYRFRSA